MSLRGRVALALLTMYIAWGTTYVGIAFAIETMPDLLAMGMRFLLAFLLLLLVVGLTSGFAQFRISLRQWVNSFVLGIMMLAVGLGVVSSAEHVVPIGVAALIVGSMPIWTGILRMVDNDRPSRKTLIGVLTGFVGLAIILQPGETVPRAGAEALNVTLWMGILVIGNILWSLGSFMTPRLDTPKRPLVLTTFEMFSAGIVLVCVGLAKGQSFSDFFEASPRSWAGWMYLVIVGSVVGYTTYNWLLANAPISLVSTYSYVNPIVAIALGFVIFHEPVTRNVWLGGFVVVVSVALVITAEQRKSTNPIVEIV
ncbi:MAG: EamA family transporter [Actinobacteria bacterium]|uniref:Unannotated protein n=1 Tax=freshwater metagenome TaxID=449393 RepID=A0A6J5ZEG9_9ZZZZ|nr:EamA family transporter [Actinomycetota bacterium]